MNILDLSLVLFFVPFVVYVIFYVYFLFQQINIAANKLANFSFISSCNGLMYMFCSKYTFCMNFLKSFWFSFAPPLCVYIVWIIIVFCNYPNYMDYLNIFIPFNIFFILLFIIPISFILFLWIKLILLRKEFQKYKIRVLKPISNLSISNIRIADCINFEYKNKFLVNILNKVISTIENKNELIDKTTTKFLIENIKLIDYFIRWFYFYQNKNEIILDYKFKPIMNFDNSFFENTKFIDDTTKSVLSPNDILNKFLEYISALQLVDNLG